MDVKILIIEDNEQDQKIVKRYLSKAGFPDLIFADSAERGVELARSEKPSLVVTDTNLPGMDGFEACKTVKEIDPHIKVIVITGSIDVVDAGKAREKGADDYCVKTGDCGPLIEAINHLLQKA